MGVGAMSSLLKVVLLGFVGFVFLVMLPLCLSVSAYVAAGGYVAWRALWAIELRRKK